MTLSPYERAFLLTLRRGNHYKSNPIKPQELLGISLQDANSAGRHLISLGYAARVVDGERPGALLLHITDAGISEADKIIDASRRPTIRERAKALPLAKGAWEVLKLALAALFGAALKAYIG